jgi:hypothetical protein
MVVNCVRSFFGNQEDAHTRPVTKDNGKSYEELKEAGDEYS